MELTDRKDLASPKVGTPPQHKALNGLANKPKAYTKRKVFIKTVKLLNNMAMAAAKGVTPEANKTQTTKAL